MPELLVASYLGGYASILAFALRQRPPGTCLTDFCVAAIIALWPVAMVVAGCLRAYQALQPRR
jgi:hypothetical protein